MVTRIGAGTGVVVSLVVFVLCTVFLLVLSIIFYSGQTKANQSAAADRALRVKYVTDEERNRDQIRALEGKANPAQNKSVVGLQRDQQQEIMSFVDGDPGATLDSLKAKLQPLGMTDEKSVSEHLRTVSRTLTATTNDLAAEKQRVQRLEQDKEELAAEAEQARQAHEQEMSAVRGRIDELSKAAEDYRKEVQEVKADYYGSIDRLRNQYEDKITMIETEKDALFQERAVLKERVDELQAILSVNRLRAQDPATLVDGRIVDTGGGGSDEVFIDRGRKDRIVLGMTFEAYDNEAALQEFGRLTGDLPRGKASLQVIQVGQTTSKCKITRSIPGRPLVRGDVIANAVYDPNHVFRFLVHGKFDVDGDRKPSEDEAEFLRSTIIDWGGTVVTSDQLPGDLDFLVLGTEPPRPMPLPPDATQFQIDDWVRKRQAHEKYHELFRQASEAQIPVLNTNRFFILIGYTNR